MSLQQRSSKQLEAPLKTKVHDVHIACTIQNYEVGFLSRIVGLLVVYNDSIPNMSFIYLLKLFC
jgi:hypothetical protein